MSKIQDAIKWTIIAILKIYLVEYFIWFRIMDIEYIEYHQLHLQQIG